MMQDEGQEKKQHKIRILTYLQDYRFNSVLVRSFLFSIVFFVVVFSIVLAVVSSKMDGIMAEEIGGMMEESLAKTSDRIDFVMEEAIQISGQLALDEDVQKFMLPDATDLFGQSLYGDVMGKIEMYSNIFDYIDSIYIYSHQTKYIVSDTGAEEIDSFGDTEQWLSNLTENEYEPARAISRIKEGEYPNLISYIQPLRLTQMKFLGGIVINIDIDKLQELALVDSDNQEELYIIGDSGTILFSSNQSYLRKSIQNMDFYESLDYESEGYQIVEVDGEEYIVTITSTELFEWKYLSMIPMGALEGYYDDITVFYIILSIIGILLCIVASFGISLYCYSPVKNIYELVKDPDMYHAEVDGMSGFKSSEVQEIALNIVRNLYSNRQLQEEVKGYTATVDKAVLTALQAQINPHFLYNTLENIRWRAIGLSKSENEVSHMILNLSEILRNSLDVENQIITIEEEIQHAKLYIEIIQLRYQDKLEIIWEIDDVILSSSIIKVSLQPIIENAVYHGIKPSREQGIIWIRGYKQNDKVYIEVENTGMGIEPQEVARINAEIHDKYIFTKDHIGVKNVKHRLNLLLGEDAELYIESEINKGTKVIFVLPS